MTLVSEIINTIKNHTLNSIGVERDLEQLLADKDIDKARSLMQNRDAIVDKAIAEYNPISHSIHQKMDKARTGRDPYRSEKLPRARQRYINEIELFFLLGAQLRWSIKEGATDVGFEDYKENIKSLRFDSIIRKAKRIAGSETESAILFHLYREDDGVPYVKPIVLSRSGGYTLRPLFDQYGNLIAFGYGYHIQKGKKTIEHFDVQTATTFYFAEKKAAGWDVTTKENPTGKINIVYIQQSVAWDGVQERCDREERIDSKIADTNNYFADPMAVATADVIDKLADPDKPGKLIQLQGEKSKFDYINPPLASELQAAEKTDLERSILFDSFTPDFSFEAMKGMGTLSGEALRRAMIIGYIKRSNMMEVYGPAIDRAKNIILAIMQKVTHIPQGINYTNLEITFEFGEPFSDDAAVLWQNVGRAYNDGIISLEKAVQLVGLSNTPEEEVERIKQDKMSSMTANLFEPTL